MATWHVALSNIKASCKLTTISHPVIDSSDIVLSLLLSLQRVHCSHVWVWVMHDGSVDVCVLLLCWKLYSLFFRSKLFSTGGIYSHGNVHHSYSKELTMSWSRSVWLFCLDITYGQSLRDTYSIMSLSDWTMCHGQTYVYMAWTWHVALSNIKASCKLTTISHPVIDSSDIVLSLLLSLQPVHCSHVWVWVMHDGSVDVRVIWQYRSWRLFRSCPSFTRANSICL